jgi:3-hydroxybutyryl-CoA dehydrogenase
VPYLKERSLLSIRTVGICGAGLMGNGIAQTCAAGGFDVVMVDVAEPALERGLTAIKTSLGRFVAKGTIDQAAGDAVLGRIRTSTKLEDLAGADLVIEAIVENVPAKRELFAKLDALLRPEAIICSNTSSVCVIELAAATKRPDRVAGFHFFNPVPMMKLVELVRTIATSDETAETMRAFGERLGKRVVNAKDLPGFIVNRLLVPYLLGAVRMFESGSATREDIDEAMVLGCGLPMGPLTLLDFVGLDTTYYIAEIMFRELGDPSMAPPPLLRRMVLAGHHGRKSGKGFYDYR